MMIPTVLATESVAGVYLTTFQLNGIIFGVPTMFALVVVLARELIRRLTGDKKRTESAQSKMLTTIQALGTEVRNGFQEVRELISRQNAEHRVVVVRVDHIERDLAKFDQFQGQLARDFRDLEGKLAKGLEDTRHGLRNEFERALLRQYNAIVRALGPKANTIVPPPSSLDGNDPEPTT